MTSEEAPAGAAAPPAPPSAAPRPHRPPSTRGWALWIAAAAAIAALHLIALGYSPPGLYGDEASFGYDAWAVAHHGADQWGHAFPLFFRSFDDWKSPLYAYLLAPLTLVLPLSSYVIRLPAALCGLASTGLVTLAVLRLTRSRGAALLTLLTAGVMPWLVLESRVAFDVTTLTLALSTAIWCLAHAESGDSPRWFIGAGIALGLAVFAYQSGRALAALLAIALVLAHCLPGRRPHASGQRPAGRESELSGQTAGGRELDASRQTSAAPDPVRAAESGSSRLSSRWRWWCALPAPLLAYLALAGWALANPGALTARLQAVSILGDHPGAVLAAARLSGNYLAYVNAPFLLLWGDTNPRHGTSVGGLLLLAGVPAIAAGIWMFLRDWRRPLARFFLLGLLAAPLPGAVTMEGTPHAVRSAGMIPFLVVAAGRGWTLLLPLLRRHRAWTAALAALAAAQLTLYLGDLFSVYPTRAALSFDAGQPEAIARAHQLAGGHQVLLSKTLGEPASHALLLFTPAPANSRASTLAQLRMQQVDAGQLDRVARRGDLLVLGLGDVPPHGAVRLFAQEVTAPLWLGREPSAIVYRVTG